MRPFLLAVCLFLALALPARATMPLPVQEALWASSDDPRTALPAIVGQATKADLNGDAESRFWWELAALRVRLRMTQHHAARANAEAASAALAKLPQASESHRLWLELGLLDAVASTDAPAPLLPRATTLRARSIAIGDHRLACEATNLELWLLLSLGHHDDAWATAEALERCGRELAIPEQQAAAQLFFAILSRMRMHDGVAGQRPNEHLDLALQALGQKPARYFRMLVEWEAGLGMRAAKQHEQAIARLQRARALSEQLSDLSGVAMADVETAAVLYDLERYEEMLPLLANAPRLLAAQSASERDRRMPWVLQLRIQALVKLRRPEVMAEVERGREALLADKSGSNAGLQRAMAAALAAQQQHAAAYEMLRSADEASRRHRSISRDAQMLRLQARYESARREAENAELRRRTEADRAALQAESERRRMLMVVITALVVLAAVALSYAVRELNRRRQMADLALRDELSGLPNRRSVEAYAREQFAQARRLGLPLSIAVIDLDHFKSVNDRFGHPVGDIVLRGFAQVVSGALRGQDRLGRWGGEEWLLVMPGTRIDEMALVFNRLRRRFASAEIAGLPEQARCTFSMGVAELEPDTRDVGSLIATADSALYVAKDRGRDRYASPRHVKAASPVAEPEPEAATAEPIAENA